jgi:hypothetical protein
VISAASVPEMMSHWNAIGPSDNGECISRLPDVEGDKPKQQKFKRYPIGFFHIHCPAVHSHRECHEKGHRRGSDRRGQVLALRRH